MMSQDGEFGLIILTNSIPSAKGKEPVHHVPNKLTLCIFQLAGRPLGPGDFDLYFLRLKVPKKFSGK
jgi:hypothetical protein